MKPAFIYCSSVPAGVAEQFAIAEAKLRAWASIDDDDEEDSNDEDSHSNGQTQTFCSQSSGTLSRRRSVHFFTSLSSSSSLIIISPSPSPNYPSISRCSDFLLLPQTPPRPILSQKRPASLRSTAAARHRPPTAPWAPAAAAAACSAVGLRLTMTHIHPRPIHLLYPATA